MPATSRRPRRLLLPVVGVTTISALAGCAVTGAAASTSSAPSAAPARPVVATAAAPPVSRAPALSNTGVRWPTVVGSLLAYGQWLLVNPNPALATMITEPGCASNTALTSEIQSMADDNSYLKPSAVTVTSIAGPAAAGATPNAAAASLGGQVTIDMTVVRAAEQVLDRATPAGKGRLTSAAQVLSYHQALAPTDLRLTLVLGTDNRWRFCSITDPINDAQSEAINSLL